MKTFAGAMAALLIIIAGINMHSDRMNHTLDNMKNQINEIIDFADKEQWQNCNNSFSEFINQWQTDKRWFSIFIHSDKIALISEVMSEIETFIGYENTEQTVARAKVLNNHLKSISENERLTAENVL